MSHGANVFEYGMFSKKSLRRIIIPLIIEQALMLSVGMFDTLMVSYAGESAVSGVSLVDSINTLLIFLLTALATGGAIVAGQYLGSKNLEKSNQAGEQLIISSLGICNFFGYLLNFQSTTFISVFRKYRRYCNEQCKNIFLYNCHFISFRCCL